MTFDNVPLWGVYLLTAGLILLSVEIGFRAGIRRHVRKGLKSDSTVGAMVAATMGLLAFMLAFTFNAASERHDTRRRLVLEEANEIETVYLRAGLLPQPAADEARALLREYADHRIKAVATLQLTPAEIEGDIARAETIQQRLWGLGAEIGQANPGSCIIPLFITSLNDLFEVHQRRIMAGLRSGIAPMIWVTLYFLVGLTMAILGFQVGLNDSRSFVVELALALAFSAVILLIADLDRPRAGQVEVSQQALVDVQAKMKDPGWVPGGKP